MGFLLSLFSGPLGSIITTIITGLFIVGTLYGIYFMIQNQAEQAQLLIDQKVILTQVIKDQNEFIAKTKEIEQLLLDSQNNLNSTIATIQTTTDQINKYLSDPNTAKNDRQTSDIIKEVIRQLGGK